MKRIFYFIIFCALTGTRCGFSEIHYPDFLISMTRNGKDFQAYEAMYDCQSLPNLQIFQFAYAKNVLLAKQNQERTRIPKIIHQIWLGSPVPEKYFAWMRTWMNWLGWEYKLWTDDEIDSFILYNRELYERANTYGERKDVSRLEILLHYGGLFVDVDFECLREDLFDELGRSFDFYIGFEPIIHGTINGIPKICNGIIASTPYHPIIKNLIVNMKSNWIQHEQETGVQKAGPDYFSRTILDYEKGVLSSPEKGADNSQYRNMYLPCTFFYPFSDPDLKANPNQVKLRGNVSSETAGIPHWSGITDTLFFKRARRHYPER